MESHIEGSEEGYKVKKEDAKANDKRMSQADTDKEMAEIREELDVLIMLLEENQRKGWSCGKSQ